MLSDACVEVKTVAGKLRCPHENINFASSLKYFSDIVFCVLISNLETRVTEAL